MDKKYLQIGILALALGLTGLVSMPSISRAASPVVTTDDCGDDPECLTLLNTYRRLSAARRATSEMGTLVEDLKGSISMAVCHLNITTLNAGIGGGISKAASFKLGGGGYAVGNGASGNASIRLGAGLSGSVDPGLKLLAFPCVKLDKIIANAEDMEDGFWNGFGEVSDVVGEGDESAPGYDPSEWEYDVWGCRNDFPGTEEYCNSDSFADRRYPGYGRTYKIDELKSERAYEDDPTFVSKLQDGVADFMADNSPYDLLNKMVDNLVAMGLDPSNPQDVLKLVTGSVDGYGSTGMLAAYAESIGSGVGLSSLVDQPVDPSSFSPLTTWLENLNSVVDYTDPLGEICNVSPSMANICDEAMEGADTITNAIQQVVGAAEILSDIVPKIQDVGDGVVLSYNKIALAFSNYEASIFGDAYNTDLTHIVEDQLLPGFDEVEDLLSEVNGILDNVCGDYTTTESISTGFGSCDVDISFNACAPQNWDIDVDC